KESVDPAPRCAKPARRSAQAIAPSTARLARRPVEPAPISAGIPDASRCASRCCAGLRIMAAGSLDVSRETCLSENPPPSIDPVGAGDNDWLALREMLWPDSTREEHAAEMARVAADPFRFGQFLARDAAG